MKKISTITSGSLAVQHHKPSREEVVADLAASMRVALQVELCGDEKSPEHYRNIREMHAVAEDYGIQVSEIIGEFWPERYSVGSEEEDVHEFVVIMFSDLVQKHPHV